MLLVYGALMLQLPIGTPNPDDNSAIDLSSPFDVIVFIVMPIAMIIFYIVWRRAKRKDK
ncbi:adenylosuccinate synthetase [Formosa sp. S-31]|uniref:adenylosuccinate synthetase n=1 Tax=Formosa sp. S-31 TaxID=2790949 RepID=UPI003EB85533